jgi:osmotically-inducible protein OsmY
MSEESRAAQIERAIREVADLDVVVEESDGAIVLEGIVDSERDSQAAEDIAADLSGGLAIDNSLEIENELPYSVDAFNDEVRSAEATEPGAQPGGADFELDPDFTDQPLTGDGQAVAGPTNGADDDANVNDGEYAYVPAVDPVSIVDQEGQDVVLGGFGISALDDDEDEPDAQSHGFGDEAIADAVRRELREDAATTDLPVRVAVRDGVAYLHGTVGDLDDVDAAEEVASRVPGVREVQEALGIVDRI